MGNIGDAFTTSIPTVGSGGPAYATNINAILAEVMARLSTKVPLSSISLASSLDMNGQAILNATYLTLQNTASSPGASPINRITAFNGDFYWVGPSGPVQITSGGALNAAGVGGIGGDYGGANPAQLRYDAANTRYEAYHNFATGTWAHMRTRGVDISAAATGTIMAQLRFGGAGTLTFTFPPTLPAAAAILGMDAAGAITANPTINTDITLGGATLIKHGDRKSVHWPEHIHVSAGTVSFGLSSEDLFWELASGTTCYATIGKFDAGERIKSVRFRFIGTAGNLASTLRISGTAAAIPTTSADSGGFRTLTVTTPYVIGTDDGALILKNVQTGGTVSDIFQLQVVRDRI